LYLLLMGWCLRALCFMLEVFYNCIFSKRIWSLYWGIC
jgi:hypothetical protein